MLKSGLRKQKGTMILHGVTSGFGFSRALRSRLHQAYDRRYRKKHRMPRLVFVFDAALGFTMIALFVLVASMVVHPPIPPTLRLTFAAPAFEAGKVTPLSIRVTPTDDRRHANVRVTWHIPHGWEILEAEPPIQGDGTVVLGTIPEGQEGVSHLLVRMFDPVGQASVIGFTVRNTENGIEKEYTGTGERTVMGSALTAEVPELFRVDQVTSDGAVVPIKIVNTTPRTIPFVELRPTETSTVQFPRIAFGDIGPGESRFAYVSFDALAAAPRLEWALFAASRELLRDSWSASLADWDDPVVERPLVANPMSDTTVRVNGGAGITLLMVRPFLEDAVREFSADKGVSGIMIPASNVERVPEQRWFAAPVKQNENGTRVLGPATFGVFTGAFPFSAEARYRSEAGDQLGLGPHPPISGEETRYWIFWNVGPIQGTLRNVRVETTVPSAIRLTGSVAAPDGGSSDISGRTIRWNIPEIGSDTGVSEALFGFEISVTPQAGYGGEPIQLTGSSEASAVDQASQTVLTAEKMALFSDKIDIPESGSRGGE